MGGKTTPSKVKEKYKWNNNDRVKAQRNQEMPNYTCEEGESRQETIARRYVQNWEKVRKENIGLLFWGDVGTGKTYLASCIANALMEQEVSVKMVSFSYIIECWI